MRDSRMNESALELNELYPLLEYCRYFTNSSAYLTLLIGDSG